MLYKDHCNRKSNHQHIGTVKCSNLCTEVIEYSSPDEVAVCNLASIAVNMFVNVSNKSFDFNKLKTVAKIVTRNLDKVIDVNFYPIPETKTSNQRHRPIGKVVIIIVINVIRDMMISFVYNFIENCASLRHRNTRPSGRISANAISVREQRGEGT